MIFEHIVKTHRSGAVLFTAACAWIVYLTLGKGTTDVLFTNVGNIAQVVFFLIGAMALVEAIEVHKGFHLITNLFAFKTKRQLLWCYAWVTFFLSSVLDNMTTTLIMLSFLRKLDLTAEERLSFGGMAVVAANAGGAWTPIGDITTTMLWVGEKISTWSIMKALFLPSIVSCLIPLLFFSYRIKGPLKRHETKKEKMEPGALAILGIAVCGLLLVPVIKELFNAPPFVGVFLVLGVLWLFTDIAHADLEERKHLKMSKILTRVNTSAILFFVGILLLIASLEAAGVLNYFSNFLLQTFHTDVMIAAFIGILSAVIDNIPLVAASIQMYPTQYPIDAPFWNMIAYVAGVGGNVFLIGSAAGIVLATVEKVNFITYLKKISLPAFCGFLGGFLLYLFLYQP